jgi:alkylated DNA repair protein (DNA oxidative demethylase)
MTSDLFDDLPADPGAAPPPVVPIAPGASLLHGFARAQDAILLHAINAITALAPLRHMQTPGGHTMTVATTSCGALGWVSDAYGYRYSALDPHTGRPWPSMPACLADLAMAAAAQAGYPGCKPDTCLINQYNPGAKMSLHQDRNEQDFTAPIVSVSLGLPAVFLFGTETRSGRPARYRLVHGDVVVWGGAARLAFHGVQPLAAGSHTLLGARRINLTFRRAA